jgi:hypothetical protein
LDDALTTSTPTSLPARALAFLGVERIERRSVGLMTAHSFFMGCATVFFETAASASFLARFDSRFIPWVYLAAAVVNIVTGSIYARVQKRASFSGLMKGTLWFLLVLVATVRIGFGISNVAWVAFAGLVSYRIIKRAPDELGVRRALCHFVATLEKWPVVGAVD